MDTPSQNSVPWTSQPSSEQTQGEEKFQNNYLTPYLDGLHGCADTDSIGVFRNRVKSLPKQVQDIMKNFNTALWIDDKIGTEFILNGNQKDGIRRIIREILLCDMYMGDIPKELQETYKVDEHAAKEISRRIVFQLFTPAIDEIKKMQKEKYPHRINPGAPPPIAPSDASKTTEQEQALKSFDKGEEMGSFGDTIDLRRK